MEKAPSRPDEASNGDKGPALSTLTELAFGVSPADTHPALQTDCYKELVNKLAWALGSTYRVNYGSQKSPARQYAQRIVQAVLRDNGYPVKISINGIEPK